MSPRRLPLSRSALAGLVLAVALAPSAAGDPVAFHVPAEVAAGATFEIASDAPEPCVCVLAGVGIGRVVWTDAAGHPTEIPAREDGAACRSVAPGVYRVEEGGPLRLVAFAVPSLPAASPGVYVLGGGRVSLLIDGLSPEGRIGMNVDDGFNVTVLDLARLEVVAALTGPVEEPVVVAGSEATWDTRFIVALDAYGRHGDVRVDWDDPAWFRPDPTLGHLGVVVAAALFLVFYRPKPT